MMEDYCKFYIFKDDEDTREYEVEKQNIGDIHTYSRYNECYSKIINNKILSKDVLDRGNLFKKISNKEIIPGMPYKSDKKGFYIETNDILAFRGILGKDLSKVWHMLVIPRDEYIIWVGDLKYKHINLLKRMMNMCICWININRRYFQEKYKYIKLADKDIDWWLDNPSYGFHIHPTVGYLHMHFIVGPLTEFGSSQEYLDNWVSIDTIINYLEDKNK